MIVKLVTPGRLEIAEVLTRSLTGMMTGAVAMLGVATMAFAAQAQTAPAAQDNAPPPPMPGAVPLTPASPPLATEREGWIRTGDNYVVHNVSSPVLIPVLPPAGQANGTAVIIAPGGGFMMLSMTSEGFAVAHWLAQHGISAYVLKYRLNATPPSAGGLMATLGARLTAKGPVEAAAWFKDGTRIAVEDAAQAVKMVRSHAAGWGIDPKRIGFMGFSAGAFTTIGLVERGDPQSMPDFVAPIYGSMNAPEGQLPATLPPMWASMAADDPLLGKTDFGLINAWRAHGGSVEFHLYEKGGHGYGFAGTAGTTTTGWPDEFLLWLRVRDLAR